MQGKQTEDKICVVAIVVDGAGNCQMSCKLVSAGCAAMIWLQASLVGTCLCHARINDWQRIFRGLSTAVQVYILQRDYDRQRPGRIVAPYKSALLRP